MATKKSPSKSPKKTSGEKNKREPELKSPRRTLAIVEQAQRDFEKQQKQYQEAVREILDSPMLHMAQEASQQLQRFAETHGSAIQGALKQYTDVAQIVTKINIPLQPLLRALDTRVLPQVFKILELQENPNGPIISLPPPRTAKNDVTDIQSDIHELRVWISELKDEVVNNQFDKTTQGSTIKSEAKNVRCLCKHCNKELFRVSDISHFLEGTFKCSCGEIIHLPRDLQFAEI